MAGNEEDHFRVKPTAPKSRGGPRSQRFVSQVLKQVSKTGAGPSGQRLGGPNNTFGRGRVAASMAGLRLGENARRVVIKSRFVVLRRASPNSVAVHLRYIERDGVTRDGQKAQAYGADSDVADLEAFQERGHNDRHQFRFIVSAEDGLELEDLKGFTRQLMRSMQTDLETRLDWVAVDHWDTGRPHTHIVLNGHTADGDHLVIAPGYMARGMRQRAREIATEWLGPRTDVEMRQSLMREVDQQRFTSLDRALIRDAGMDGIHLTESVQHRPHQNILRTRLRRLEGMGLSEHVSANHWTLKPWLRATLDALSEREDARDVMLKALNGEPRELALEVDGGQPITGRIAGKGLVNELMDHGYLVVDGIDGRAHYLKLAAEVDLDGLPIGGIVEAKPAGLEKVVDNHILAASQDGIYTTTNHAIRLVQARDPDPQVTLGIYTRRLEALRRAGVVERIGDGVWRVPKDLPQQARRQEERKTEGLAIELRSHLPIEQQVRSLGATWLDRQLLHHGKTPVLQGFGARVREAMDRRAEFLVDQGLAERRGQRLAMVRNLLATLRDRELASAGKSLEAQTGLSYRPLENGQQVSGRYRLSIQLDSGRFAMLDDGLGFQLVSWKPPLEQRLGQQVRAVVRNSSVTWDFGRQFGPQI